jgi:RNA polymerase-interacting CarD/CdnL/TRCF family regulator
MSEGDKLFSKGDWVFHLYHGVGQVKGLAEKTLAGETKKYYEVEARNGTFWIPISKAESDRIRPVAGKKDLKKAIKALKKTPRTMANKHTSRKKRINDVTKEGDLIEFCSLLRDLQARRVADKLNTTEQRAHRKLKKIVASEWAASEGIPLSDANKELNAILRDISGPEGENN